jgi:hypothetical protein
VENVRLGRKIDPPALASLEVELESLLSKAPEFLFNYTP